MSHTYIINHIIYGPKSTILPLYTYIGGDYGSFDFNLYVPTPNNLIPKSFGDSLDPVLAQKRAKFAIENWGTHFNALQVQYHLRVSGENALIKLSYRTERTIPLKFLSIFCQTHRDVDHILSIEVDDCHYTTTVIHIEKETGQFNDCIVRQIDDTQFEDSSQNMDDYEFDLAVLETAHLNDPEPTEYVPPTEYDIFSPSQSFWPALNQEAQESRMEYKYDIAVGLTQELDRNPNLAAALDMLGYSRSLIAGQTSIQFDLKAA